MAVRVGDVVSVCFAGAEAAEKAAVLGVVESVDVASGVTAVFVGGADCWRVPVTSVRPIPLATQLPWASGDLQRMRTAAAQPATSAIPSLTPTGHYTPPPLVTTFDVPPHHEGATSRSPLAMSFPSLMSPLTNERVSAATSMTAAPAPATNLLYELDAHVTGLYSWTSVPLTVTFVSLAYAWMAIEAVATVPAEGVMECLAVAVLRSFVGAALCACVCLAPAQKPSGPYWLVVHLVGLSLGGLLPPRVWRAAVVCCTPVCFRLPGGEAVGPLPALLWVAAAALSCAAPILPALGAHRPISSDGGTR
ncbi:hypothetical protein NESM_000149700 [Novymonas esmeraldas]|uniref:Uncharacterized protein n=1 Tax=Novymonas esmeraldas TaxID=1808958 RepID=A0AAW0F3T9_9TRYP